MKKITIILFTVIMAAGIIYLSGCNKNYSEQKANNATVNEQTNDNMFQHILDFKKRMDYYRENPGLKSNEKEQTDSTVLDWESTINLTYCYSYLELSDAKVFDTILAMPPINDDSILMSDVSDKYYNEIVYAVQAQYFQAPFPDSAKKLMVVDLEKTSGGDSLYIKSMIGNTMTMAHPPYDWMYGEKLGTCDGQHDVGIHDATHILETNTRNHFKEDPPTGYSWTFINIDDIYVPDPTVQENGNYLYRNPSDDPGFDNYKDFLIYYANSTYGTVTHAVKCLEHYDELDFYKQSYINLTQDWIDASNGKKFKDCCYVGKDVSEDTTTILKHELETFIGNRILAALITPDDISQY